jgi:molecular chaperone IbpA
LAKEDLTMFDLSPLYRSTVGFERLAEQFEQMTNFETSYPPYNIERLSENEYRIAMAVAGFAPDDLTIEVKDQTLTVWNKEFEKAEEKGDYLHQGIATRNFKRGFELADHVKVTGAEMENGLLFITLKREEPEAMKPWVVPIRKGLGMKPPVEAKKAA